MADNTETEYFEYLEALRVSGVTNMFGAPTYLQKAFGLSRKEAADVFLKWVDFKNKEGNSK